jgi:hypothetical protein
MTNQNRVSQVNAMGQLIANIYSEVFQRTPENPNSPLNTSQHLTQQDLVIRDDIKSRIYTDSSVTYKWGPSGFSDEAITSGNASGRWGFTAEW